MFSQRAIPIGSGAAVALQRIIPTATDVVAAAVSTTQFDLTAITTTANALVGLDISLVKGTGAGQTATITANTVGRRVTVTPALTTQPSTDTTVVIGPSLPAAYYSLSLEAGAANLYYSFRSGGTAGTDRILLPAGMIRSFSMAGEGGAAIDYIEILATIASDTCYVEFQ